MGYVQLFIEKKNVKNGRQIPDADGNLVPLNVSQSIEHTLRLWTRPAF